MIYKKVTLKLFGDYKIQPCKDIRSLDNRSLRSDPSTWPYYQNNIKTAQEEAAMQAEIKSSTKVVAVKVNTVG